MQEKMKYQRLQELLKAELTGGAFRAGDRFYTEREIMEKYHMSGITVSRALREMTAQGYFVRKRKQGTFVLESPEMPGMSGNLMIRPLYINRASFELTEDHRLKPGPSWFVIEEIRRGIINTYPGMVKIEAMDQIMEHAAADPGLLAVLMPQNIPSYQEKYAPRCPEHSIRIILPPLNGEAWDCVRPNYLLGTFAAVEYLIRLGHRRIAFIGNSCCYDRIGAYRIALETYGIPMVPELFVHEDHLMAEAEGETAMKSLLKRKEQDRPTAVFCATDRIALGAAQALATAGLRIPEDLSLVGFDDVAGAIRSDIALTTVHVPYYEVGKTAVEMLLERIRTGRPVPARTLMTELMVRETAGELRQRRG